MCVGVNVCMRIVTTNHHQCKHHCPCRAITNSPGSLTGCAMHASSPMQPQTWLPRVAGHRVRSDLIINYFSLSMHARCMLDRVPLWHNGKVISKPYLPFKPTPIRAPRSRMWRHLRWTLFFFAEKIARQVVWLPRHQLPGSSRLNPVADRLQNRVTATGRL